MQHTPEAQLVEAAFLLANRAAVADIESGAVRCKDDGVTWWDTRPMLDPAMHPPEFISHNAQTISYATASGLATAKSPEQPLMLRINGRF